ncbi:MAG TPA: MutL protein [Acholeplasma sp.]|jgi:uncharacterized protein (TIGR01319 family)|nr:methylaspartate mutase accessory protein GlmL [Acholeplasmatales bacterium]HHV33793.1 MutL protein [Acholeplasma sp.]
MSNYLFIDLGSTFTKLTLIDFDKLTIVGRASSPTTVETDVTTGFHNALKLLRKNIGEVVNYEKAYACSSAAGGLKMAAIGLVTELTTEAAKRVCLGSGAKVELVFSGILTDSDVKKLKENDIDIILLAGGIDGGDKKTVIENSKILARLNLNVPIVYAGNNKAIDEVGNILSNNKIEFYIAENVMPKLNKLNVLSAKNLIQKIFIEKIVDSKGIGNLSKYLDAPIIPTPVSVINVASLLSNMDEPVVIVDIGGATTDIYSVGYGHPKRPDTALIGLEEPLLKRTVEGDLGMRYSIKGLLSNLSEYDKDLLNNKFDLTLEIDKRNDNVFYLPENKNDSLIEEHFASLCASIAFSRHVGTIEEAYTHGGLVYYQTGKDLTDTRYLIGTGGVIVNNSNNKEILKSVLTRKDKPHELRPVNPKILIDKGYLLSAIGLLSQVDKKKALELLKKEILKKE